MAQQNLAYLLDEGRAPLFTEPEAVRSRPGRAGTRVLCSLVQFGEFGRSGHMGAMQPSAIWDKWPSNLRYGNHYGDG